MPIMYSTPMATRTTNVEMMKPCSMGFAPERQSDLKFVFNTEVYDHDDNILIDNREPEKTRVISKQTAWLLTSAMHDVVVGGTGSGANSSTGFI